MFAGYARSADYAGNETRVAAGSGSGILVSQGVVVQTLKLRVPAAMTAKLYNWILVEGFASLVSLIVIHGAKLEEMYRLEIHDARISEITLPDLHASGETTPVTFDVTVSMRDARHVFAGKGRKMPAFAGKSQALTTNAFQMFIQGYESIAPRIVSVGSIGRIQPVPGADQRAEKQPVVPKPMSVSLDVDAARPLMEWCDSAARGSVGEKPGLINLFGPEGKVQASIDLIGLFPRRVTSPFPGTSGELPLVEVVLESREQRYNFKSLVV